MKCHYEILNITRDAADEDIKKSYRKLALRWHPDKNPDEKDECTRQFHLIQQAYEVLIDPQERAWYDKHREAILKGGHGQGGDYKDTSLNVYQYFNTACFSGYGDDDEGFYTVYRKIFEKIAEEDAEYLDGEDSDSQAPSFGDSLSEYEEVVGVFYAYWDSYCTAKSYVWVEEYDTRQAPNRMYRRAAEQENKKTRDKAKRERNEEVRALVAFVRKRDRRVHAYKKRLEERAVEIAKKAEERKQRHRKEKLKELDDYTETKWSAMSELETDLASLEANLAKQFGDAISSGDGSSDEEEEILDELFCIACNKNFKTDKAFANHERSKKHRENVALLKAEMEADEEEEEEEGSDDGEEAEEEGEVTAKAKPADKADVDSATEILDEEAELSLDEDMLAADTPKTKLSKKQKKRRKQQQKLEAMMQEVASTSDKLDDLKLVNPEADTPESPENKENAQEGAVTPESEGIAPEIPAVPTESAGNHGKEQDKKEEAEGESCRLQPEVQPESKETDATPGAKGANKKKPDMKNQQQPQEKLPCNKCGQIFRSRNKLFDHIKKTGHALRVEAESTPVTTQKDAEPKAKGKGKKKGKR